MKSSNKGFTLIEILVVIGIIAILAAIVIVSINPAARFKQARNSQRQANVESILNAVQQNMVDNKGITTCSINASLGYIKDTPTSPDTDLKTCLSKYLAIIPSDPTTGTGSSDTGTYYTGYQISMNSDSQVTVVAPSAEGTTIKVVR